MKILVLGAGQMGIALVQYYLAHMPQAQITFMDVNSAQLKQSALRLSNPTNTQRLTLGHTDQLEKTFAIVDLVLLAIPWKAHAPVLALAARYNIPLISLSRPAYEAIPSIKALLSQMTVPVILGCGLEPGLTEILARYCATQFDTLTHLNVYCGGVTKTPPCNPLHYKALFGTHYLPTAMRDAYTVKSGQLVTVPRFSECEQVDTPVGTLEAWHDGLLPWLSSSYPEFASLQTLTQKTLRWPGFSAAVNQLATLGLLSETPITINDFSLSPKQFLEYCYEKNTLLGTEENITLLLINGEGLQADRAQSQHFQLIATQQEKYGLNSMAFITGYTAGIIGRHILSGEAHAQGLTSPEVLLQGKVVFTLLSQLRNHGVGFSSTLMDAPAHA